MELKPRLYDTSVDVRFADLDSYNHLNVSKYIDLVITSRWIYYEKNVGASMAALIERGVGFYIVRVEQDFLRPVTGICKVRVQSFVKEVKKARITVAFELMNEDRSKLYSKGTFECAVIDLKTQRPMELPEWVRPYFFEI